MLEQVTTPLTTHELIGWLFFIIFAVCLLFAVLIFCVEILPKAYWRRRNRERIIGQSDWRWRYGRPGVM